MTREQVKATADEVIELSADAARQLPGVLGTVVPARLRAHGYYACTVGDKKVFFELREVPPYSTRKALRDATLRVGREKRR